MNSAPINRSVIDGAVSLILAAEELREMMVDRTAAEMFERLKLNSERYFAQRSSINRSNGR